MRIRTKRTKRKKAIIEYEFLYECIFLYNFCRRVAGFCIDILFIIVFFGNEY